jgi:hypothetical protein
MAKWGPCHHVTPLLLPSRYLSIASEAVDAAMGDGQAASVMRERKIYVSSSGSCRKAWFLQEKVESCRKPLLAGKLPAEVRLFNLLVYSRDTQM